MPVGPYPDFESCVKAQMSRGYDEETAKKICGKIEWQTREARFTYKVKAEPFKLRGGRYARVRVIDTTTSRPTEPHGVKWRVTDKALTRALRTLLQAPLIGPPELGHAGDKVYGLPIQVKGNGSAEVIYEIVDPEAWRKIRSGEWRSVSPQVLARSEERNDGVAEVTDCIFEHVALVPEGAFSRSKVESIYEGPIEEFGFAYSLSATLKDHSHPFTGDRTARDDVAMGTRCKTPNQPQVPEKEGGERGEFMSVLEAAEFNPTADWPDSCFAYVPPSARGPEGNKSERKLPYRWPDGRIDLDHLRNALARWSQTEFHSQEARMETLRELCQAAKEANVESSLCEEKLGGKGEVKMSEEKDRRIAELEAEVKRLQGELSANRQKLEILERKEPHKTFQAELERLKAENKELKEWKSKVIAEELAERAGEVEDLRIRAGLADERDRSKDIEQLKLLSAEALDKMRDDLLAVVTMIESEPAGPKARFRVPRTDSLTEQVRATLYGYTRNEGGEVN
ncbi:MAG: hypothetical protein ACUVTM_06390 [Candidatus Bathyarchaeia archaeon]